MELRYIATELNANVFTVWNADRTAMIGSYVKMLMPGRPGDRWLWIADIHDVETDADGYDPIHLGVYDDPATMEREMRERWNAVGGW